MHFIRTLSNSCFDENLGYIVLKHNTSIDVVEETALKIRRARSQRYSVNFLKCIKRRKKGFFSFVLGKDFLTLAN